MINVDSERSAGGCAKWWRECVCEKDRAWQRETEQKEQKEGEQERGRERGRERARVKEREAEVCFINLNFRGFICYKCVLAVQTGLHERERERERERTRESERERDTEILLDVALFF
jgi:hypothetical protein